MTGNDTSTITIPSSPEKIAEVDEFLEDWLRRKGIPEDVIADLAIAVTELVNNAIKHGNKKMVEKKVTLILRFEVGKIEASVTDQGEGFDLNDIPDPLAEENLLKEIGRGIFIVKSLMDDFRYSYSPGKGSTLSITKKIS